MLKKYTKKDKNLVYKQSFKKEQNYNHKLLIFFKIVKIVNYLNKQNCVNLFI